MQRNKENSYQLKAESFLVCFRLQQGWSISRAAALAGMSAPKYYQVERDAHKISNKDLLAIATLFRWDNLSRPFEDLFFSFQSAVYEDVKAVKHGMTVKTLLPQLSVLVCDESLVPRSLEG